MKTTLLAVIGMSPAVITETLYGLHGRGDVWPDNIKVITTAVGAQKLIQQLINANPLHQLCHELGKPDISFTAADILVVPGSDGVPVADARSTEDHEALANFIVTTVRDVTRNNSERIHASIAGGRKTMTFYLGYAMSLFGRRFDSMSHVLVSEGYENHPEFFFPTRSPQLLQLRDGRTLDASDATITLADIPFIRQRHLVPQLLKEFRETVNFRELVELINLGEDPAAIRLSVYTQSRQVKITSVYEPQLAVTVQISNPWHWALYVLLAEESIRDEADRGSYGRPQSSKADEALAAEMALKLAELNGLELLGDSVSALLTELIEQDDLWTNHPNLERSLVAVKEKGGITGDQFSTYINTLQTELAAKLPANLVLVIAPGQTFDEQGELLAVTGRIKNRGGFYGIPLPDASQQIRFVVD